MATSNLWSNPEKEAITRLEHTVDELANQRNGQLFVCYLADALFWGLLVSALAVLAMRLAGLSHALTPVTAALVVTSLSLGALLAWRRKPGKLAVAIMADERLGFKQRLSTAWEFRQAQPDAPMTRSLAVQAVGRRHATVRGVFPFEFNLAGMLIPLAAASLLLASYIDLQGQVSTPVTEIDTLLVEEGTRLKIFAGRMKLRAEREGLARSPREAAGIQKLGAEMQAGAMQRAQALQRLASIERSLSSQRTATLRELARSRNGALMSDTNQTLSDATANSDEQTDRQSSSLDKQSAAAFDQIQGLALSTLRDRLSAGELSTAGLDALERAAEALGEMGSDFAVWGDELSQALQQYADGESSELSQILESLIESEQLLRDAEELDNARVVVSRASENLGGESLAEAKRVGIAHAASTAAGNANMWLRGDGMADFTDAQLIAGGGLGRSQSKFKVLHQTDQLARDPSSDSNVTLKPQSKTTAGDSFKSETWALPKAGEVTVENREIDARFKQQLEAVQAKESYPLHRKEYLRRYFLNLSNIVHDPEKNRRE